MGAAYLLGIDYFICVFVAINSEELHVCSMQEILRVLADCE